MQENLVVFRIAKVFAYENGVFLLCTMQCFNIYIYTFKYPIRVRFYSFVRKRTNKEFKKEARDKFDLSLRKISSKIKQIQFKI